MSNYYGGRIELQRVTDGDCAIGVFVVIAVIALVILTRTEGSN